MPGPRPMNFGRWMSIALITYAAMDAIFVGLGGLALNLSFRSLWLPFGMFFLVGVLLTVLLYWTRQSYDRPKSCAMRLAFTIFSCSLTFMLALVFSAMRLSILSQSTALNDYAPYALPGSLVAATVVYLMARKKLQAMQLRSSIRGAADSAGGT